MLWLTIARTKALSTGSNQSRGARRRPQLLAPPGPCPVWSTEDPLMRLQTGRCAGGGTGRQAHLTSSRACAAGSLDAPPGRCQADRFPGRMAGAPGLRFRRASRRRPDPCLRRTGRPAPRRPGAALAPGAGRPSPGRTDANTRDHPGDGCRHTAITWQLLRAWRCGGWQILRASRRPRCLGTAAATRTRPDLLYPAARHRRGASAVSARSLERPRRPHE
jgi:hypothetical protein